MHYIRGMERSISATDANREFSRVLNEVAGGETYIVTSRGKPVAKFVPMTVDEADRIERNRRMRALLERLAREPARNLGRVTRDDGYE
ncbi:hypothetical protein KOAAANKH_01053 [Brevundimonas sp. NIBR10]|uniref:type II toxin-antitoxin system Phd/YefM family antitoxin n=1 Tax=Brevundimonas sp. NIBR10 TaxID=3015997 RepID=UPI0022F1B04D|nr:type II toxin-antitoxin system prevent-host-death family antitoxin [Brevundimonas sp. NIBR10]WGM46186.1 hypothetical protein KOAAANKH_01053 [Brevundimonas sp. NIBR10]